MRQSYGFIETIGLASAIEASDIALKAAGVNLVGLELAKGFGYTTVKLEGTVSSVQASIEAVKGSPKLGGRIVSTDVIPRPNEDIDIIVKSNDNLVVTSLNKDKEDIEVIENLEETKEVDLTGEKPENEEPENKEELIDKLEPEEDKEVLLEDSQAKEEVTCNLCGDPSCSRKKGEPRKLCINNEKHKEE